MERARPLRHRPQEPDREAHPGLPDPPPVAQVRVIWGPNVHEVPVQEMTVGQAFRVLQAPFNLQPGVQACVNGEPVSDDHELEAGDTLEFVHKPGEKGARGTPEVRIRGDLVSVVEGRKVVATAPVADFAKVLAQVATGAVCGEELLPRGVRLWLQRGDVVGLAVEVLPHTRSVHWLRDDSKRPYGRGAGYDRWFLAFPFVVLLLVFRGGALTHWHQLYYRTRSLELDDELLLPNLYNVAKGYSQQCWVCLQQLPVDVAPLPWWQKVDAIVDHVFTAAFNRSSEVHEGNSYWSAMKGLDSRLKTIESWQEASRENPLFPLEVAWKPAGTSLRVELTSMLDQVAPARALRGSADFAGMVSAAQARKRRS